MDRQPSKIFLRTVKDGNRVSPILHDVVVIALVQLPERGQASYAHPYLERGNAGKGDAGNISINEDEVLAKKGPFDQLIVALTIKCSSSEGL